MYTLSFVKFSVLKGIFKKFQEMTHACFINSRTTFMYKSSFLYFQSLLFFLYMKSNDIYRCLLTLIDYLEISLLHTISSIVTTTDMYK